MNLLVAAAKTQCLHSILLVALCVLISYNESIHRIIASNKCYRTRYVTLKLSYVCLHTHKQ